MDDAKPAAGIGHNNPPPPTLAERFDDILKQVEELAALGTKLPTKIENDDHVGEYAGVVNRTRRMVDHVDGLRKEENEPHRQQVEENNAFFNALADRLKRMRSVLEGRTTEYNNEKAAAERRRRAEEAARLEAEAKRKLEEAAQAPTGIEGEIAQENAERAAQHAARAAAQTNGSDADMARVRTAGGTVSSRTVLDFKVADYGKIDLRELKESFGVDAIDKAIRAHIKRHKKTKPLKGVEIFETSKASFRG